MPLIRFASKNQSMSMKHDALMSCKYCKCRFLPLFGRKTRMRKALFIFYCAALEYYIAKLLLMILL